jgi:hypothetical protein
MNRKAWMVLILIVAVALGSLHEFLFVNLNYQIDHVQRHTEYSYAHSAFQAWTRDWSGTALVRAKWSLALAFAGIMLGLTIAFARQVTGSHRYRWGIIGLFVGTAVIALALHGLARWWPPLAGVGVKLLHLLQFPVLLFFIWAASQLRAKAQG